MEQIGKDDVYKAERILDTKNVKGKRHYLIKWDGWDESNNTWEPEKNIIDVRLIDIFNEERKNKNNSSRNDTSIRASDENKNLTKHKSKNGIGYSKEDDLRSVIREAEGLRPLIKTRLSTDQKTKRSITNRSELISSSESVSSSELSDSNHNKSRGRRSSNRFMRRRKISSSSRETSSSSRSSVKSIKISHSDNDKRKARTKKTSEFNRTKIYDLDPDEFDACVTLNEKLDISDLIEGKGEDVFVTDVTSGQVTVTIKECLSAEGFFKKRDTLT